jgi:hypothetical protein
MSGSSFPIPPQVDVLAGRARVAAGLGMLALLIGGAINPAQGFRSYLFAYLFWMGVPLGSLALLMIHHLSGGRWGLGIRRMLEAAARTLYLAPVLFLPVVSGVRRLYIWSHADVVAADPILGLKAAYLNVPFFLARAAFYFACWAALAHFLSKWSEERDRTPDARISARLEALSGGGLVLLALTLTFAVVDWAMSLNPHWFSTIYGVIFIVGYLLAAMAFVILLVAFMGEEDPLADLVSRESMHDLGKLLLAFVLLWAYIAVSQLIIVWSANLPEEIPFYLQRLDGGWLYVSVLIVALHFVLPFAMLLSRELKRNARVLAQVAGGLLVMRLVDLYWLIGPDLQGHGAHGFHPHWLDLAAPLGLGGLWLLLFTRELKSRPLVTPGDPELAELLAEVRAEEAAHV